MTNANHISNFAFNFMFKFVFLLDFGNNLYCKTKNNSSKLLIIKTERERESIFIKISLY